MRTETLYIYKYEELSDDAKANARVWYRNGDDDNFLQSASLMTPRKSQLSWAGRLTRCITVGSGAKVTAPASRAD